MFERSEFFSSPKNEYCRWSRRKGLQQNEPNRQGWGAGRVIGQSGNTRLRQAQPERIGNERFWRRRVNGLVAYMIRLNHNTDSAAAEIANTAAIKASKPEISVSFFSTVSRELSVS